MAVFWIKDIKSLASVVVKAEYNSNGFFVEMDALRLQKNGIKNVIATLGTALTFAQTKLARNMKEKVVLCFDADNAGQKAVFRAFKILSDIGISVSYSESNIETSYIEVA